MDNTKHEIGLSLQAQKLIGYVWSKDMFDIQIPTI